MPKIIPIKDLKNTTALSSIVHESDDPVYVTKNGYDDMVIMSSELFDRQRAFFGVLRKLVEGERSIARGEGTDAFESISKLRSKYGL
jgi:hypothetical protein